MAIAFTSGRTFVYGTFETRVYLGILAGKGSPDIGIEILREFSPTELIGKIYVRTADGGWLKLSPTGTDPYKWYENFRKSRKGVFHMQEAGKWQVLYFRQESDADGSYVAVALKKD